MKKFIIFLILMVLSLNLYADIIFDEICSFLNGKDQNLAYNIDKDWLRKPIRGRGYVLKVQKDAFGDVKLYLSTSKDKYNKDNIEVIVSVKYDYKKEALKYRRGDYIYFSGIVVEISKIARQIFVSNAAVSRYKEIIKK
ncbi:MAG: hypothetical protein NC935_01335 [Candidatus Omnitrophica bacterium]|nr:hypothetical protein [Candidatus Omnitrophota bacterium]